MFSDEKECSGVLSADEITAVRKNLQAKKTDVTDDFVRVAENMPTGVRLVLSCGL